MAKCDSHPASVLVALAACCWLAGCAGSAERLPECRGRPVPINSLIPAAASMGASGRSVSPAVGSTARVSEVDAH